MFTSKEALYTDKDPNGPEAGRVLSEGDPDARFVLIGAGGTLEDDIAKKFKLGASHGVTAFDADKARAELVAANRQTYTDNALVVGGAAYKGLDGEVNPAGVAPDKIANVQGTLASEANKNPLFEGLDSRAAKSLQDAGLDTPEKIAGTSDGDLKDLRFVGDSVIATLRERAGAYTGI